MRILFERGGLRLHVDAGDALHAEALETWREACALAKTSIDVLPPDRADAACQLLAETATHALAVGRDERVIAAFQKVERQTRYAENTLRAKIIDDGLAIFAVCLLAGTGAGLVWIFVEPYAPWNALPNGLNLVTNYILLVLGWAGFTLIGFSIGWLFSMTAVVRIQDRMGVLKQAVSLRQRKAHIVFNALFCLVIVIVMFFFGGFDQINKALSEQLTSAPWAILLGLVAGVAEPGLSERIRSFLRLS